MSTFPSQSMQLPINTFGKTAGILTADEALAKHYLALGALFVAV
jgi:2-keto-3-deoxy-L-rhamnonate aldolase RhmA